MQQSKSQMATSAAVKNGAASTNGTVGHARTSSVAEAIGLAEQYAHAGKLSAAAALCRDILARQPNWAPALHLLGDVIFRSGNHAGGIDLVRRAISVDGGIAHYHYTLGRMYLPAGFVAEAKTQLEQAIALNPRDPLYHFILSDLKTFTADDPQLRLLEDLIPRVNSLPPLSQPLAHFTLAKAYEDLGQYDDSFLHLKQGNLLRRRQVFYDETRLNDLFERVRATFDRQFIEDKAGAGYRSTVPVFVVGIPRSGTTLVEQILASHPSAYGAGELPELGNLSMQLRGPDDTIGYPEIVREVSATCFSDLGERYVRRVCRLAPEAARIVDKMPPNFMQLGLIHLALPDARIIHVVRSPLDTCFSSYATSFGHGPDYAYDLGELGRNYRRYAQLMAHWRDVLPQGRVLEVRYEAVVSDLETETRRLLDFCGLSWNPVCLAFHQTRRAVFTASAAQVRRPVYRSSEGRWRHYREHLGPLIEALGDLADVATPRISDGP